MRKQMLERKLLPFDIAGEVLTVLTAFPGKFRQNPKNKQIGIGSKTNKHPSETQ